jgi:UDP-N-acetylglucosamine--N-acetylmuramyl-(pentapeptide) pyrophosphoryl-undecaprenol N-acetylglucosamine transferase
MEENTRKKLILVTGGHLTPAVAVLNELKKRGFLNFIWVGHKFNQAGNKELSPEFVTVKNLGIKFISLSTGKLTRKWTTKTLIPGIKNIFLLFWGFIKSFYIIIRYRPRLILSFGGYLAVPIVIIGRLFSSKVITHEQTIVVGLANKFISKFADKILISWESSKEFFDSKKTILTGNPIRRDIFITKSDSLTKSFDRKLPILLIYGGNQGSHEINKRVFEILNELLEDCNIIHQTGNSTVTNDYRKALDIKERLPFSFKHRYEVRDYILQDEVGEALNKSDLILGRSGANNVSEILALGKLCVLIPIPWASHDEQTKNAEFVAQIGLGYVLTQKDSLTSQTLYQTLLLGLNQLKSGKGFNGENLDKIKEVAKSKIILDAPQNVANEVEKLI